MNEQKKKKYLNEADYEKILNDKLVFGKTGTAIAKEIGCGDTSVFNVLSVFQAVRDNNWARCVEMIYKRYPIDMFNWAAKKLGVELPKDIANAYSYVHSPRAEEEPQEQPTNVQPASRSDNTALYLTRLIEELAKLNENMAQLMDTVIPKYAEDQRSATMKVASVLCAKIQPVADNIDVIKRELVK